MFGLPELLERRRSGLLPAPKDHVLAELQPGSAWRLVHRNTKRWTGRSAVNSGWLNSDTISLRTG